jgi:hypothetical protein
MTLLPSSTTADATAMRRLASALRDSGSDVGFPLREAPELEAS